MYVLAAAAYDRQGFSFYAVIDKMQQTLIGICGLLVQKIGEVEEINRS